MEMFLKIFGLLNGKEVEHFCGIFIITISLY